MSTLTWIIAAVLSFTLGVAVTEATGWEPEPLKDRQAVIHVEEDGSYGAGCVPGAPCDDTAVKP